MSTTTRRRPLTPEQVAATADRRAKFRDLAAAVSAMTDAERAALAARIMPTTIEGHALSVHNAALAYMQRPDVTIVGGFRQWAAAGRQVRKDEHGIMVWAPTKNRDEDSDRPGFVPITLFDIAQTDESEAAK